MVTPAVSLPAVSEAELPAMSEVESVEGINSAWSLP
jgi:hypothetical protein